MDKSQSSQVPPVLPPKPPFSPEGSRSGTPAGLGVPPSQTSGLRRGPGNLQPQVTTGTSQPAFISQTHADDARDPGGQWLPDPLKHHLESMSIQDLEELLNDHKLLDSLTHSSSTAHSSLQAAHGMLDAALSENVEMATQVADLGSRVADQRAAVQAKLLATHALERQWRQRQSDMDVALGSFSPAALYQRLSQGIQEQSVMCQAMEESFLNGGENGGPATEREIMDWLRRYRDAKVLSYLRQERRERWDEGRVGGWR